MVTKIVMEIFVSKLNRAWENKIHLYFILQKHDSYTSNVTKHWNNNYLKKSNMNILSLKIISLSLGNSSTPSCY